MKSRPKVVTWNWDQYLQEVKQVARALIDLKISEKTCINIVGANSPEWACAYFGAMFANCIPCGADYKH